MRARLNLLTTSLCIAFCFGFFCVNAQVQDTVIYQYRLPGNSVWSNTNMEIYSYNDNCQYTSIRRFYWNSSVNGWDSEFNTFYTYTSDGVLLKVLDQQWNSSTNTWDNIDQVIFNTQGTVKATTFFSWNTSSNQWDKIERHVDSLNNFGNRVVSETFLPSNDTWQLVTKSKYAYNDQQEPIRDLYYQIMNDTWTATNKHEYNYTDDDLSQEIKGFWRTTEQDPWVTFGRDIHNFLPVTKLESLHLQQAFYDNTWVNQYRDSFTYINNNQPSTAYHLYWNNSSGGWVRLYRDQREYYKDGSLHYLYNLVWGHDSPFLNYDYKATFTHHGCKLQLSAVTNNQQNSAKERSNNIHFFDALPLHSTKDKVIVPHYMLEISKAASATNIEKLQAKPLTGLSISPNPAKDYFTVTLTYQSAGISILKITDISGKTVLQKQIQNNTTQKIQLPSLPKGIYIVSVISANNTNTQKLVVQ